MIIFDAGPVISFALNGILWVFEELKKHYDGEFIIPPAVRGELVNKPLTILRYKLEAFQVLDLISDGIFTIKKTDTLFAQSDEYMDLANRIFYARGHPVTIIQRGEVEALIMANELKAKALVVDERTTRLLVEQPQSLRTILANKLHTKVTMDRVILKRFSKITKNVNVIRSVELFTVAYELGILERYLDTLKDKTIENPKLSLLEAGLWALKYKGATVSEKEIKKILKIEK